MSSLRDSESNNISNKSQGGNGWEKSRMTREDFVWPLGLNLMRGNPKRNRVGAVLVIANQRKQRSLLYNGHHDIARFAS